MSKYQEFKDEDSKVKHFDDIVQQQSEPKPWNIKYYRSYFQVNTPMVFGRIKKTLIPQSGKFFEDGPADLYGPLWISTTLVFLLVAAGHFASLIEHKTNWGLNVEHLITAMALVYGLMGVIPVSFEFILPDSEHEFVDLVSIYGYSYFVFIPACVLCVIPFSILRWIFMGVAAGWSGALFLKIIWPEIQETHPTKKYLIGALGVLGHILIFLVSNLHFYDTDVNFR